MSVKTRLSPREELRIFLEVLKDNVKVVEVSSLDEEIWPNKYYRIKEKALSGVLEAIREEKTSAELASQYQVIRYLSKRKRRRSEKYPFLMVSVDLSPIILKKKMVNFFFLQKRLSMATGTRERLKMPSSTLSPS